MPSDPVYMMPETEPRALSLLGIALPCDPCAQPHLLFCFVFEKELHFAVQGLELAKWSVQTSNWRFILLLRLLGCCHAPAHLLALRDEAVP